MSFDINQQVIKVGTNTDIGTIVEGPIERRGQIWYKVRFGGNVISCQEQDLSLYTAQDNLYDAFRQQVFGGYDSFIIRLTLSKLFQPIKDTLYSYNASRTELHGYQYKPLLKYLNSTTRRLLIADEVGLGKTIEAGYILQEERARRNIARALIVCPAALRIKWHNEMLDRFGINFDVLDYRRAKKNLPKNPDNPRSNYLYGIASYDSIRSDSFREQLEANPSELNILIVDEVHHCRNRETKNFKIIEVLAETSDAVIFLSATPIHTENKNLFNLLNLLVPDKFTVEEAFYRQLAVNIHVVRAERYLSMISPEAVKMALEELQKLQKGVYDWDITQDPFYPVVLERLKSPEIITDREYLVRTQEMLSSLNILNDTLTRTKKRDVHEKSAIRSAYPLITPFTDYEGEVYQLLIGHIYKQYERNYNDQIARFVLCNFARQISSSLVSAVEYYQQLFQSSTPLESDLELDDWEDEVDEEDFKNYRIADDIELRDMVNSFSTERLRQEDTKFNRLLSVLEETHGKVIIFAFYKRSLRYLEERFSKINIRCIRIDGDVPSCPEDPERDERNIRIESFRDDPAQKILLSSQVGSEGLDFQFCDTLVNWDLPWNPMVVEQRIGRIDRLGQESEKIHIYNMVSKGSIEEYILEKLYMRINIFQESIGELEQILGPKISDLTKDLLSSRLTKEEKIRKIEIGAQAVLREKEHMLNLEKRSVELIGHNEIIQQKLEKVSRLGRYINGEHLERFVSRFLEEYHPTSRLCGIDGSQPDITVMEARILNIDHSLRTYMATKLSPYDEEEKRFRDLLRKDKIKVAFHAEIALRNPDAEMIHSRHPLVIKIAEFYKLNNQQLQAVFRLKLATTLVEPGIYFWAWASIDETGVFTGRYLKPLFINLKTELVVENDERGEELLYHLLMKGVDWSEKEESIGIETCNRMIQNAEDMFMDYVADYRQKRVLEANAVISRQKQAIESTYAVLMERKQKAVETAKMRRRPQNIINALTAQCGKLRNDFDMKIAEITSNSDLSLSYHTEGIGLVKIYHD